MKPKACNQPHLVGNDRSLVLERQGFKPVSYQMIGISVVTLNFWIGIENRSQSWWQGTDRVPHFGRNLVVVVQQEVEFSQAASVNVLQQAGFLVAVHPARHCRQTTPGDDCQLVVGEGILLVELAGMSDRPLTVGVQVQQRSLWFSKWTLIRGTTHEG
jgi:hypothetical protein